MSTNSLKTVVGSPAAYLQRARKFVPVQECCLDILDVLRGVERELYLAQRSVSDNTRRAGPPRLDVIGDAVASEGRCTPVFHAAGSQAGRAGANIVSVGGCAHCGDGPSLDKGAPGGRVDASEPSVAAVVVHGADAGTLAAVATVIT